ncbi:structure-specific endonuclease subunit slx1 [Phtheirospermum japonicum]|uniref:Structure-specific endonuclease subunit SLX1 homolog n=1 Tax=Phtheirospermum japonicum TaxID=374723 RepID=A0A830CMB2_9LAMI|nr:structure-specific endonuclease subunit slx1 [Phtheirospermum japonicum]
MGKRKTKQTLIPGDESGEEEGKGAGFFACYLLTSLCPRFKGHTYIGYTLNPRRRIRQHNGEIGSGAWRTKRRRPWEMVLCIYGFPSNTAALQFEWAWQHPVESLAVRTAAASFKSLSGLANKIKLAYTMLTLPAWQSLNLTVNMFSTKYQSYTSACPPLPEQMRTRICSMDELPCYNVNDEWDDGNECEDSLLLDSTEGDDQGPSFNESPARKSFSLASPGIVESTKVVELTTTDLVADKDQVLIKTHDISGHEVEIIDVFTPSPCKKRSRRSVGPEIIDLTNSPLFV